MSKSRSRRRVGHIIRRHIYSLNRSNGTFLCRSNSLLHCTHFTRKRRLITHCRRHTSQQSRNFRTGLSKTEYIIYKEKYIARLTVFTAFVAHTFSYRQTGKSNCRTCSGRLIHLTINKCSLTFCNLIIINFAQIPMSFVHGFLKLIAITDNTGINHFTQQIVTLTSTFSHSGKHRETVMNLGDIIDKFHDKHSLTYAGTTEQTNFSTFQIRFKQVYDLDTGKKNLLRSFQLIKFRSFMMYGVIVVMQQSFQAVNAFANNVHHPTLYLFAGRHRNGFTSTHSLQTTFQTVSIIHCHGSNRIFSYMLLYLRYQFASVRTYHMQRFLYGGQNLFGFTSRCVERYIYYRTNYLRHTTYFLSHSLILKLSYKFYGANVRFLAQ